MRESIGKALEPLPGLASMAFVGLMATFASSLGIKLPTPNLEAKPAAVPAAASFTPGDLSAHTLPALPPRPAERVWSEDGTLEERSRRALEYKR